MSKEEKELRNMLDLLRIKAETNVLQLHKLENHNNDTGTCGTEDIESENQAVEGVYVEQGTESHEKPDENQTNKRLSYLKSACEMVRLRSSETAVTFLYLPKLPSLKSSSQEDNVSKAENYLTNLEILTNHWPPTLLVRGVSPVTSTTL